MILLGFTSTKLRLAFLCLACIAFGPTRVLSDGGERQRGGGRGEAKGRAGRRAREREREREKAALKSPKA